MLRPRSVSPAASVGVRSRSPVSSVVPHEVAVKEAEVCTLKEQLSLREQQLVEKERQLDELMAGDKRELDTVRSIVGEKVLGKVQQALQWNESTVRLNEKLAEKEEAITSLIEQLSTSETKHDATKLQLADLIAKVKCKDRAMAQSSEEISLLKQQNEHLTSNINTVMQTSIPKQSQELISRKHDVESSQYEFGLQIKQVLDMVLGLEHFVSNFGGDNSNVPGTASSEAEDWCWDKSLSTLITIGTPGNSSVIHPSGTEILVSVHGVSVPEFANLIPKGHNLVDQGSGSDLVVVGYGGLAFPPTPAQRVKNTNSFILKPYLTIDSSAASGGERVGIRLVSASSGSPHAARTFLTTSTAAPASSADNNMVTVEVFASPDPVHPGGDLKCFISLRSNHVLLSSTQLSKEVDFNSVKVTGISGVIESSITKISSHDGGYSFTFTASPNCNSSIEFKVSLKLTSGQQLEHNASVAVRRSSSGGSLQQQLPIHIRSLRYLVAEKLTSLQNSLSDCALRMTHLTEETQKRDETTSSVVERLERNESSLVAQLNAYRSELSEVTMTVDQYTKEAAVREDKMHSVEQQLQKATTDLAAEKESLQAARVDLEGARAEISSVRNEKVLLESENQNLIKNNTQLMNQLSDLQGTLREVSTAQQQRTDLEAEKQITTLRKQLADLDKQSKEAEQQSKILKDESTNLRQELQRLRVIENELASSQSQLMLVRTNSEKKISLLELELSNLRNQPADQSSILTGNLIEEQQKVADLEERVRSLTDPKTNPQISALITSNAELKQELQNLRQCEATLIETQQRNSLEMRSSFEKSIQTANGENVKLREQLTDLRGQIQSLKLAKRDEVHPNEHQLQQQLRVSELEVSTLRSQLSSLQETHQHIDCEVSMLSNDEDQDQDHQKEVAYLRAAADQAVLTEKGKTQEVEQKLQSALSDIQLLKDKQEASNQETRRLQQLLATTQTELATSHQPPSQTHSDEITELRETIKTLKQQHQHLHEETTAQLQSQISENIKIQSQVDASALADHKRERQLQLEIEELRHSTELKVLAEEEKTRHFERQIIELQSQILSLENSLDELKEENNRLSAMKEANIENELTLKSTQDELANLREKILTLEKANTQSEENLLLAQESLQSEQQTISSLKLSLDTTEAEAVSMKEQLSSTQTTLQQHQTSISELEVSLATAKQLLEDEKLLTSSIQKQLSLAEQTSSESKSDLKAAGDELLTTKLSLEEVRTKCKNTESDLIATKKKLALSEQTELNLLTKHQQTEREFQSLRRELTSLVSARDELSKTEGSLTDIQQELSSLRVSHDKLQYSLQQSTEQLTASNETTATLRSQLSDKDNQLQTISKQYIDSEQAITVLNETISQLTSELAEAQQVAKESDHQPNAAKPSEQTDVAQRLLESEETIVELRKELLKKESDQSTNPTGNNAISQLTATITSIRSTLAESAEKVADLEVQLSNALQQISRHEEAEGLLLSENDELMDSIRILKSELHENSINESQPIQNEIDQLKQRLAASEEQALHDSAELLHLRQQLREQPQPDGEKSETLAAELVKVGEELVEERKTLKLKEEELRKCTSELISKTSELASIEQELSVQKSATQSLSEKLLSSQQEIIRLNGGAATHEEVTSNSEQVVHQKESNDLFTKQVSELREELNLKNASVGDLQRELETIKAELTQEKQMTHALSQKLLHSQEQLLQLTQQTGEQSDTARLQQTEAELSLARQRIEELRAYQPGSEHQHVKDRFVNTQSDLQTALEELHAAKKEVENLRETLEIEVRIQSPPHDDDQSNKALRKRLLATQADLQRALQEIESLKEMVRSQQVTGFNTNDGNGSNNNQIPSRGQSQSLDEPTILKERLKSTQSDLKHALQELHETQEELNSLKATLPVGGGEQYDPRFEELETDFKSTQNELLNAKNEIVDLKESVRLSDVDIKKLMDANEQLQTQLRMAEQELLDSLQSKDDSTTLTSTENEGLKTRVLQLANELLSMTSERDTLQERIESLEVELQSALEGADQVVTEWTLFENSHHKLAEEHASSKAQVSFVTSQQQELSIAIDELQAQLTSKTDEVNHLKHSLLTESDRVTELESVILKLQQEAEAIKDLKAINERQELKRKSLDNQKNNFEREVSELTTDNMTLVAEIESLKYEICVLTANVEGLQLQNRKLSENIEAQQLREKKLLRDQENTSHSVEMLEGEKYELQQKIVNLENMIANLRTCASTVVCTLQPGQTLEPAENLFTETDADSPLKESLLMLHQQSQTRRHILSLEENCERESIRCSLLAGLRSIDEAKWETTNSKLTATVEALATEVTLEKESHKETMRQLVSAEEAVESTENQCNAIEFQKAHVEGMLSASKTSKVSRTAEAETRAELSNLEFIKMEGKYLSEEAKNAELRATILSQQEEVDSLRKDLTEERASRKNAEQKLSHQNTYLTIHEAERTDDTQALIDAEHELVTLKSVLGALQNERRLDLLQHDRLRNQISEEKNLRHQAEQNVKQAKQMAKELETTLASKHETSISDMRDEVLHVSALKAEREQQVAELFRKIEATSLELNIQKHRAATSELALKEANKEILSLRSAVPRYQQSTRRTKSSRSSSSQFSPVPRGFTSSPIRTSSVILEK